jgi:hypothetical protein
MTTHGYMLDMKQSGFGLVALSYHVTARHADPLTDKLYLVLDAIDEPTVTYTPVVSTIPTPDGATIYEFDGDDTSKLIYLWRSKFNLLPREGAFQVAQIDADDYTDLTLRLYANGSMIYEVLVTSAEPFTLPTDDEAKSYEWELIGSSRAQRVQMAETVEELT